MQNNIKQQKIKILTSLLEKEIKNKVILKEAAQDFIKKVELNFYGDDLGAPTKALTAAVRNKRLDSFFNKILPGVFLKSKLKKLIKK